MRSNDYERYLTAANDRDWAVVAEHVADEVHVNGRLINRATYVSDLSRLAADHPDHHWQVADMVSDGDHLAVRLTTTRSTGQGFELALYRWADGQIAEVWTIGTGDPCVRPMRLTRFMGASGF
jgi:predicted ester cyclase